MSAHLDTDALADVLAGLGHPAHLDECAACQSALQELSTALASVTVALAQLPDPVVPPELTERLEAAVATERGGAAPAVATARGPEVAPEVAAAIPALIAPAPAPAPAAVASTTITPIDVKRSGPPAWTKAAGGLAVAASLVVGVVLVVSNGSSKSTDRTSAAPAIARNDTGFAYTKDAAALRSELPALLKGNAPKATADAPALGQAQPNTAVQGASPTAPKSSDTAATAEGFSPVDALAALRGQTALAACLASLSDPDDPGLPLALDYGTFQDAPALLVILPSPKASSVLAYFVGPDCNATDSHLLYYVKLDVP